MTDTLIIQAICNTKTETIYLFVIDQILPVAKEIPEEKFFDFLFEADGIFFIETSNEDLIYKLENSFVIDYLS